MPASSRPATTTGPERLTDIFRYHSALDPDLAFPTKPWRLGPWLWATQGHILVALQNDGSDAEPTPEAKLKARRYLDETPEALAIVPWRALAQFAGKAATSDPPCDDCDGSGYADYADLTKCEHCGKNTRRECSSCGGDGRAGIPIRHGFVGPVPINLELLAYALTFVPDCETVRIGSLFTANRKEPALLVVGPTWRVVVMSIRDPGNALPTFALPSVDSQTAQVTETEDAGSQR